MSAGQEKISNSGPSSAWCKQQSTSRTNEAHKSEQAANSLAKYTL